MDVFVVWLPPAVTLGVLLYFIRDLKSDMRDLRNEFKEHRAEIHKEIGDLRIAMHTEIGNLRNEVQALSVRVSNIDSRVSRIEGVLEGVFRERLGDSG